MPELPEVETIARELNEAALVGCVIKSISVFWDRSIADKDSHAFCKRLTGQTICGITRRGKYLVFSLTCGTVLLHLRMTGKLLIDELDLIPHSHERVRLHLSDGRVLRFEDQRKFGKWYLANAEILLEKVGLEPLSLNFTLEEFKNVLAGRHRQIKPFLLDQSFVAGLGNIYTDEALWEAQIHPFRLANSLSEQEIVNLHAAIISVLKTGVSNTGTSLGAARANYYSVSGRRGRNQDSLKVFRHTGLPCPRCQTKIQKVTLAQRGTHFCPHCQK